MQEDMNNAPLMDDEEGIDIMALVKQLWDGRKTIIIWTCAFIVLGFVAALTMKRTYSVSTVMVPQVGGSKSSSLSSLASLAGIDLSSSASGSELSPLIYPQIVNSVPFRKELMYTPVHYAKVDTAVSMFTYATEIAKPTVMGTIKKYTIGLPGVILGAIRKEKPDIVLPAGGADDTPKPLVLSKDEVKVLKAVARITDKTQNVTTTKDRIEHDRIQSKYNTANSIYSELSKQLEQAKLQVKRDTPVLTVIQPVTVPDRPSNSRAKTLIVWTFFGAVLGCGIVLAKNYWPKLKEQFKA